MLRSCETVCLCVFGQYAGTVQENKAGEIVARLDVTDRDEPLTANSVAKFTIIQGNEKGFFNISTGPSGMEGVLVTSKVNIHSYIKLNIQHLDLDPEV